MRFDAETRSLSFASHDELADFHRELTALLRQGMMNATKHIEDPKRAKQVSRALMRETRTTMSTLNLLRRYLPKKEF